jgi:hypothetical protein
MAVTGHWDLLIAFAGLSGVQRWQDGVFSGNLAWHGACAMPGNQAEDNMVKGERVHIVCLGYDANLVVAPLEQMGCDRIYAFTTIPENTEHGWRSVMVSEVINNLLRGHTIIESRLDLSTLYEQLETIVAKETHAGNSVFINVSSGTRVFTAAAALVSAKHEVELYYVHTKAYHVERDFAAGIERVEVLNHAITPPKDIVVDATLAFVLMPFSPDMDPIYEDVLIPVLRKLALRPVRADEIFNNRQIMDDIWDNIERSRVIIADLTGKNPNVFYETGIAHAPGQRGNPHHPDP